MLWTSIIASTIKKIFSSVCIPRTFKEYVKRFLGKLKKHTVIMYCGVAPRGRSIERPLLINGYAYLAVSLPDNGRVDSNS
jgi:hypothetical protein